MPPKTEQPCRARCFTMTIWSTDILDAIKSKIKYGIFGREICPTTGNVHWQSYVEFTNQQNLASLRKRYPKTHIVVSKGSAADNIKYCSKENNFEEVGERPKGQGKRTDLEILRDNALAGITLREQLLDTALNYQQIKVAEKYAHYLGPRRTLEDPPPCVIWIFGKTGLGKSYLARKYLLSIYNDEDKIWCSSTNLQWWDKYDNHPAVILDDFRSHHCRFSELLVYLDRYHTMVPVKGGFRNLVAKHIIITSPFHPEMLYDKGLEDQEQLLRRISYILKMTETEVIDTRTGLVSDLISRG